MNKENNKENNNEGAKIYFGKYKQDKKIGEGSFGKIYIAININTNEKFAIKLESKSGQNLLESEAYVLCYLKGPGIPAVKSYGFSGDNNVLVMELLHKSLEDLFQESGGKYSIRTVCFLGLQMLDRIEYIHSKHIIHRDIKPDNFVMGINDNCKTVYIIDFGLAKKYRSSRTLQHIPFKNNKKLTGTARYASINALKGLEQSRRDDLEAIGYVLMYFLRGSLPWQGLKVDKKEDRYKKIYEKKKSTTPEELCKGYAAEFCQFVHYTRNLAFEQEPDYNYLRDLLKKVLADNHLSIEVIAFDWERKRASGDGTKQNRNNNNNANLTSNNILNTNENTNLSNSQNNVGNLGVKSKHNSNNNIHLPNINQYKPNNIVNPSKKSSAANDMLKKTLLNSIQNTNGRIETEVVKNKLNSSILNNINESKINNSQYMETNNNISQLIDKNNLSRNALQTQLNFNLNTNNITNMNYSKEDVKPHNKSNISLINSTVNNVKNGLSNSYVKSPIKSDFKPIEKNSITPTNKSKSPMPNLKQNKNDSKCIII